VCEESPELDLAGGGRPGPGPFRPLLRSRGFWSLLDGRKSCGAWISLCNRHVGLSSLFPDNPLQKQINNKTRGILSNQTLILGVGCILVLSLVYLIIKIDT